MLFGNLNNVVVEYKGGGYDGCHWEWNWFGYDKKGKWYDIGSSGRKAVTSEDDFNHTIHSNNNAPHFIINGSLAFIYDLDHKPDVLSLIDNMAASRAIGVAKAVEQRTEQVLEGTCYGCETVHPVIDMNPDNWAGDGHGVEYYARDLFCSYECAEEVE